MKKLETRTITEARYYCDVCQDTASWHDERSGRDYCYEHAEERVGDDKNLPYHFSYIEKER